MSERLPEKLEQAIAYIRIALPHLASALAVMDIRLDGRIPTAAILPSGRVLFSPSFVEDHTMRELGFVVAHELYHALYGVFDRFDAHAGREDRWLVNVAHDFIINDLLEKHLCGSHPHGDDDECYWNPVVEAGESTVPDGALVWRNYGIEYQRLTGREQPPIEDYTLEGLVLELRELKERADADPLQEPGADELPDASSSRRSRRAGGEQKEKPPSNPFDALDSNSFPAQPIDSSTAANDSSEPKDGHSDGDGPLPESPIGGALRRSFKELLRPPTDDEIMTEEREREMFPDESEVERRARRERFEIELELGSDEFRKALSSLASAGGHDPGDGVALVKAFAGEYKLPWEAALQKSIDDFAYTERTWARASRRAGDRSDVVLPGRSRAGYQLNIVADTSGSMVSILPMVLGLIQTFGRNAGLSVVRIVQCDSEVQADDVVGIDELSTLEMKGMGGGMDPPGMLRMAEDPLVERVLVLTDGYIDIPEERDVPYDVTWCLLTYGGLTEHFQPPYGRVIGIPIDDFLKEGGVL